MWVCSTCSEMNEGRGDDCWNCGTSRYTHYNRAVPESVRVFQQPQKDYTRKAPELEAFESQPSLVQCGLILSTTPTLQTHTITEYLNVVTGEAVMDANIVNDVVADLMGARASVYERYIKQARHMALNEVIQKATKLEAHGVVGLTYETQAINTLLVVSCWGTAVRL